MTLKKRPSVIVMKRLDTQGLRLLSQSAGPGTRRAGVRLSANGGLMPHRRGEPISDAPPPEEWPTDGALAIETPAFIDTSGQVAEQLRSYARALAERQRAKHPESARHPESGSARHPESGIAMKTRAPHGEPPPRPPLPALLLEPPPRTSRKALGLALLVAGIACGLAIARIIGVAPKIAPPAYSPAPAHLEAPAAASAPLAR